MNDERKEFMFSIDKTRQGMFSTIKPKELNEILSKNLDEVILLVFSTQYSGESIMLCASIDELAEEYEDGVRFFHINADENADYIESQGIHQLPTLFIYAKSELVYQGKGLHSKSMLRRTLKTHIDAINK